MAVPRPQRVTAYRFPSLTPHPLLNGSPRVLSLCNNTAAISSLALKAVHVLIQTLYLPSTALCFLEYDGLRHILCLVTHTLFFFFSDSAYWHKEPQCLGRIYRRKVNKWIGMIAVWRWPTPSGLKDAILAVTGNKTERGSPCSSFRSLCIMDLVTSLANNCKLLKPHVEHRSQNCEGLHWLRYIISTIYI